MTPSDPGSELGPEPRTAEIDGRAISYRAAGDGPVTLLLHGIGSGSASFQGQLDGLSGKLRLIAWDAPGYGGSDPLEAETPSAADYADAARALLDALGLKDTEKIHLVGHSLGTVIASAFAARYPEKLLTVTLASATAGYAKADHAARVDRLNARIATIRELGPAGMAASRGREVLSPDAPPQALEKVRAVMSALHVEGYCQAARMLHSSDIYDDIATIAVPALVMCGSADTVTPEALNRRIAAAIPGAVYRSLAGLGHACYVENPALFNDALGGFLENRG
jgi:pimeloyl-ACP methyl ester carboxylesterase